MPIEIMALAILGGTTTLFTTIIFAHLERRIRAVEDEFKNE
jgi:hypothetical protein